MRVSQFLIFLPLAIEAALAALVAVAVWLSALQGVDRSRSQDSLGRALSERFELPVLFYSGALTAYAMRLVDLEVMVFATLFVIADIVATVARTGPGVRQTWGGRLLAIAQLVALAAVVGIWGRLAMHFVEAGF